MDVARDLEFGLHRFDGGPKVNDDDAPLLHHLLGGFVVGEFTVLDIFFREAFRDGSCRRED